MTDLEVAIIAFVGNDIVPRLVRTITKASICRTVKVRKY